jgi:hypothetical protein
MRRDSGGRRFRARRCFARVAACAAVLILNLALGAAYTPVSIGPNGRIDAQNKGHLLVVGVPSSPRETPANGSASRGQPRSVERPAR